MRELIEQLRTEQQVREDLRGVATSAALAGALLLSPMSVDAKTINKQQQVMKEPQVSQEVRMLVGEAENQGLDGMRAVASTFRNLEKLVGRKSALSQAYGTKRKFKKVPPTWVWKQAEQAWNDSATHDYADGANHWGTDEDVEKWKTQPWFKRAKFVKRVGDHNFYKETK